MFTIAGNDLSVSILDPGVDQHLLGSRYCTGGYIWQIYNNKTGLPLLSGPRYPSPVPPQFDGQGAPEAFVIPLGEDRGESGSRVEVIGVGSVIRSVGTFPFSARENPQVEKFCTWEVQPDDAEISMSTTQKNGDSACFLTRNIALDGTAVISATVLKNTGSMPLPLRWFPHPFFPLNKNLDCCSFGIPWTLPENPAYRKTGDGKIVMRDEFDWNRGLFLRLGIAGAGTFSAQVDHPECEKVAITADYAADELPFWANSNTFSPEPYQVRVIQPGEASKWSVRYTFNEVRS